MGNENAPWTARGLRCLTRLALALPLTLGACATPPPADDTEAVAEFKLKNDPLEPMNRTLFAVNGGINHYVLGPLGFAYRKGVPAFVRDGIHHALANVESPVTLANHLLQGRPCRAGDTLFRFVINSTFGLGGLLDLADDTGIPAHDTDFGLTLGRWGVPEGPYLLVPLLGPSNPRDAGGSAADLAADPLSWIVSGRMFDLTDWLRLGFYTTDSAERWIDQAQMINRTALDPYATYRSLYRQYRANDERRMAKADKGVVCGDPP